MSLLVDDRAGSRDLMRYSTVSAIAELTRLESGDACLVGNGPKDAPVLVGVEVKSIWDLISSMNTGRLQGTQIPALLSTYDVCWLLYYGSFRPAADGTTLEVRRQSRWRTFRLGTREVPYGYVEAFLLDLAATGIRVHRVYDLREAAAWLAVLYRWWSKPWSKHHGLRSLDNSRDLSLMPGMDDSTRLRASVAAQLPGVGFERALSAANYFPTVKSMMDADAAEWSCVPGIGKVIGKAVESAIRGKT